MNKKTTTFSITIQGISPLLIHRYAVNSKTNPIEYDEEWKKTTYINDQGHVFMPSVNIQACMFNGGKSIKKGRGSMAKFVYSSCILETISPEILLDKKPISLADIERNNWLNTTGAVVGTGRIDRIRTELPPGWEISFDLTLMSNMIAGKEIKEVLENAGFVAGLGDTRPSSPKKPGSYGRFEVTRFESV